LAGGCRRISIPRHVTAESNGTGDRNGLCGLVKASATAATPAIFVMFFIFLLGYVVLDYTTAS